MAEVETATSLQQIQTVVVVLLKSLKNIYENSNFYKEARIVSFIDRLLECIVAKVKAKLGGVNVAMMRGSSDYEGYQKELIIAQTVMSKFKANLWIEQLMTPSNEVNSMNQSFYTKQGLDFLYFARPGTAYGSGAFMTQTST